MSEEIKTQDIFFSFATIGEVFEDGVSLIFDGQEEATEKHYKTNTLIWFQPGDRAKIFQDSGTYVVEYVVGTPRPAQLVGIPAGGTTGQILVKRTAADYSVTWANPQINTNALLPTGGTSGQVLTKSADDDYKVTWDNPKGTLPAGGSDGQVLMKSGATDYSVKWASIANPLPVGGLDGQVLTKSGTTNYAVKWSSAPNPLPTGGAAGQVLTKSSSANYAVEWSSLSAAELKSGIYSLKLSTKVLTPSATGFEIGTSNYPVTVHASKLRVYYSAYKYVDVACNSSGKLTAGGTELH